MQRPRRGRCGVGMGVSRDLDAASTGCHDEGQEHSVEGMGKREISRLTPNF